MTVCGSLPPLPPHSPQIDLAREASNLQRFNYNFRRTDHVRFPIPLYPLVSADVLVGVWVGGRHTLMRERRQRG